MKLLYRAAIFSAILGMLAGLGGIIQNARAGQDLGRSLAAYRQAQKELQAVWQKMDFQIAKVALVRQKATGFGVYEPRDGNVYRYQGKELPAIRIYMEPVGYGIQSLPGGKYRIAVEMDLELYDKAGKKLFGRKGFFNQEIKSHHRNREYYLNITLHLRGAPPGNYTVRLITHDLVGGGQRESGIPVVIR